MIVVGLFVAIGVAYASHRGDTPSFGSGVDLAARPRDEAAVMQASGGHELGHVVGLDHVEDPTRLMNPVGGDEVTDFATGDLLGLAQLGRGRCFPEI